MHHAVPANMRARRREACFGKQTLEAATLAAIAMTLVAALAMQAGDGAPHVSAEQCAALRVNSGDTLWSIAERHPIEGATTEQTAEAIRELNGLEDCSLSAGQVIRVPAAPQADTEMASR